MKKTIGNQRRGMPTNQIVAQAIKHWSYVAPLLRVPENEAQFDQLMEQLDELLDIVGEDEEHPLIELIDIIGNNITEYEVSHHPILKRRGINALKFLIEAQHLKQTDLTEIGSQGVVSEILSGKRKLNLRQIRLLAKRFHVDPLTFIDD